ncbi:uncharacterized protein JCM15063_003535 [Sporobolomyces koalae]|uniref:uncharacterized protein n=1 Tax=Sporobolomyces koalae TaxID=500713 RepID=UPI003175C9E1
MEEPLRVKVIVYDLLPPSKLSMLLNLVGTGVYHTSVQLTIPLGPTDTDPIPQEWAFGGHDSPSVSGVFSIPAGTAPQRMPGLRQYQTIDMGTAFGPEWSKLHRPARPPRPNKLRKQPSKASLLGTMTSSERFESATRPYDGLVDYASTTSLAEPARRTGAGADLGEDAPDEDEDDDGGRSDGTEYLTVTQRRAWRIIEEMRRDEEWMGTNYDLLKRNCNTFTEELVRRLTGRSPPPWINRAAFIATSFPCIVPAGLIDETEESAPTADSTSTPTINISDPTRATGEHEHISIEPPRADRMNLGGRIS